MTFETIALVLACFLASSLVKGTTGLGFSTVCMGLMAWFLDLSQAIPLVIIPSVTSNALVMWSTPDFRIALKRFAPMFLATLPGLGLGLWLLSITEPDPGKIVLGAALALYGLWGLWRGSLRLPARLELVLGPVSGMLTGVVNGLTGSQVMPMVPFLMGLGLTKNVFVQTVNISFTMSSLVMLAGLGRLGLLEPSSLALGAGGLVPAALGVWLGGRLRKKASESMFRRMVLAVLAALGLGIIIRVW